MVIINRSNYNPASLIETRDRSFDIVTSCTKCCGAVQIASFMNGERDTKVGGAARGEKRFDLTLRDDCA